MSENTVATPPPPTKKKSSGNMKSLDDLAAEDSTYIMRHYIWKGVQAGSLATPPILLARSLYSRSFAPSRFLRNSWLGTIGVGATLGGVWGYGSIAGFDRKKLEKKAHRLRQNLGSDQMDDYTTLGALLGSLIGTTIFLKRVPLLHTVLGGAALGVTGGVGTLVFRNFGVARKGLIEEYNESGPLVSSSVTGNGNGKA